MLRTTSIVGLHYNILDLRGADDGLCVTQALARYQSEGGRRGRMGPRVSRNVQSLRSIHSFMTFVRQARRGLSGTTTPIFVRPAIS